mmetsp:Transcript_56267/g.131136  ORF Transcript_56267/g.131136 Transcript_56267/m.131136 type:complete len:205 (+) Transcript_56267:725-1339(+)
MRTFLFEGPRELRVRGAVAHVVPKVPRGVPDGVLAVDLHHGLAVAVENHRQHNVHDNQHHEDHEAPDPDGGGPKVLLGDGVGIVLMLQHNLHAVAQGTLDGCEWLHAVPKEDVAGHDKGYEDDGKDDKEVQQVIKPMRERVDHNRQPHMPTRCDEEADDDHDVVEGYEPRGHAVQASQVPPLGLELLEPAPVKVLDGDPGGRRT